MGKLPETQAAQTKPSHKTSWPSAKLTTVFFLHRKFWYPVGFNNV
jgi:hypothetical protein